MDVNTITDGYMMFAECGNITLKSNDPVFNQFTWTNLQDGTAMLKNCKHFDVRCGISENSADIGYQFFPSMIYGRQMFEGY
jgi:hypothetical protein